MKSLVSSARLDLPLPGSGRTLARWRALAEIAYEDTVLGRLVEAHTDAVAIMAELGGGDPVHRSTVAGAAGPRSETECLAAAPGEIWGVWAAEPPSPVLRARRVSDGWVLDGRKLWCSGASMCTHALVTAVADEQTALFAVQLDRAVAQPVPGTWHAVGMGESDSGAVDFDNAAARMVGAPGEYLSRPGFWHGAIGVAACWYGSACAVAAALHRYAAAGRADDHALAHLGAVTAALSTARASLSTAAHAIDDDPRDTAGYGRIRARTVRAVVETAATETLDRVGRALGAGPLCGDRPHARRVADLTVYLRQSHAERDLADLGRDQAEKEFTWLLSR
ncbi:acyl-CoA dehydrogenase [Nocardia sp. NPDC057272]|uniref:acyl-CoA dehydrogenase n=1 Tax=Nocardia sp. NPDC057272 TaxID=3346079 RepID=UPI00363E1F08